MKPCGKIELKIRKAQLEDAPAIVDFNCRLAEETESLKLKSSVVERGVRVLLIDASKGTYFVAEHKRVIVGQLLITHEWSDWRNGDFWWIQSVYVAEAFRDAGIFSALFQHVNTLAKVRRNVCGLRLYVEQDNRRAQRVYERFGMRCTQYRIYETALRLDKR